MRALSLTSAIVSGLTLLALAVAGFAALDGRLAAGTPPKQRGTFEVAYPEKPKHDCPHRDRREADWRDT